MVPSLQIVNFESSYAIKLKDLINNNYGKANIFMYKTIKSFRAMQELLLLSFHLPGALPYLFSASRNTKYFNLKCLFTQASEREGRKYFPARTVTLI